MPAQLNSPDIFDTFNANQTILNKLGSLVTQVEGPLMPGLPEPAQSALTSARGAAVITAWTQQFTPALRELAVCETYVGARQAKPTLNWFGLKETTEVAVNIQNTLLTELITRLHDELPVTSSL